MGINLGCSDILMTQKLGILNEMEQGKIIKSRKN